MMRRTMYAVLGGLGLAMGVIPASSFAAVQWIFADPPSCIADCAGATTTKTFRDSANDPTVTDVVVSAVANSTPTTTNLALPTGNLRNISVDIFDTNIGALTPSGSSTGGTETGSNSQHTLDNSRFFESFVLTFDTDIQLTAVTLGFDCVENTCTAPLNDADITILAYTGAGPLPDMTTTNYAGLIGQGWEFVTHINDGDIVPSSGYDTAFFNDDANPANNVAASAWIVAAYNPTFDNQGWSTQNDGFKLRAVKGNEVPDPPTGEPGAPEPQTLLLFLAGLAPLYRKLKPAA